MLNLLLRKNRYDLKKEYTFRFVNILLFFVISVCIFLAIALIPSYITVSMEKNILEQSLNNLKNSDVSKEKGELLTKTTHINSELVLFKQTSPKYSVYLENLITKQIKGIEMSNISFAEKKIEDKHFIQIDIKGNAMSREILVSYANLIRTDDLFEKVDLPISSLARESNIPFSIVVTTKDLTLIKK
jgi:hypothetical protein